MKWTYRLGLTTSAVALAAGLAAATATNASAASTTRPSITDVWFSGNAGPGQESPYVTIDGSGFGSTYPSGSSDDNTSCGTYTNNGDVFGNQLYFTDDTDFEAGYSDSNSADCVGVTVFYWSDTQITLEFGNAYGTFQHWYLANGDGYAVTIKGSSYGGVVSGLG
ncbi:hypothetical protein [Actinospica sp.]|jgi:hypothetical protein|uniref:hypothetical protein n=1 Tax=Actinospica sp. TaxID=1872142 RepID=UPI002CF2D322|nr:hypothetical protein [Actinospica sp.]HWG28620.1 hypothetical protein [Actinospica sp.]